METKELIEKLIAHYEQAIEKVKESNNWYRVLDEMDVRCGVCYCASAVFGVDIYYSEWVTRYCKHSDCWDVIPHLADNKDEALRLLNVRLTNLKTELKLISTKD